MDAQERRNMLSLARAADELLRRGKADRLAKYNVGDKVHLKQLAFHKCRKRNRWVFGGNRSGKTECGAVETVWMLRGNHPYRENRRDVRGWAVSLTRQVQREVAQAKILDYLRKDCIADIVMESGKASSPRSGIIDTIAVKNVFGGISTLCFKSCEMGREKFQGASLDFVWFDEEPPEDVYDECCMRVIDRKGDVFGTMTPLKGMTFVYDRIYMNKSGDAEVWHETMEWADNPFLDKNEIQRATANLDELSLQSRRYGKFADKSGFVYPEFDENVHVLKEGFDVPPEWQDKLSIDPGLNNPTSCHWYAVDGDGSVFVVAEHYASGLDIASHAAEIKRISDALGWKRDGFGRVGALIDSAANQQTLASEKSVTNLFAELGVAVNPKVDKTLYSGIARVKQYLRGENGKPKLYVFPCCTNLIRELKTYRWGSGDTPVKKDDHALDELRYYLMSRPEPPKILPKTHSEQKKFKDRLVRLVGRRA